MCGRPGSPICAALLVLPVLVAAPLGCRTDGATPVDPPQEDEVALLARLEQERAAAAAFEPFARSGEPSTRARAALALGRLEHRAAVALLLPLVADPAASVRAQAAFALGQTDLALSPDVPGHDKTRAQVEAALVDALGREQEPVVRRALVRALGRTAGGAGAREGVRALLAVAQEDGPLAAEALTAIGVLGARRGAPLHEDATLRAALERALAAQDGEVRMAAAYAAFRQKVRLPLTSLEAALAGDAQTRIHITRAGASQDAAGRALLVERGLKDVDWRVRTESLRLARAEDVAAVAAVLDDAVGRLLSQSNPAPLMAHVVREACGALSAMELAPERVTPALARATAALVTARARHRAAACACAVAKDAREGDADDTAACAEGADDVAVGKLNVQLVSQRRVSSKEKCALWGRSLRDEHTGVRMAAAAALVADASPAAVDVAVAHLAIEDDPGVVSTLLELFTDGQGGGADEVDDELLFRLARAFQKGETFEQVEPLLAVARLARGRSSQTAKAIVAQLASHPHAAVRDAARGVAQGDREPGPRARVSPTPSASTLPAWAVLKTSRGDIRLAFDAARAPATVASFVELARARFFDGTPFHRVIADFVAQGGDRRGDGSGGPGYSIACERTDEPFVRGAVGMAHAGLDTGGSQFFLTHSAQPHLDGRYTLFAHVVSGLEVMDALQPDDLLLSVDFFLAAPRR